MPHVNEEILAELEAGRGMVLATVVRRSGSAPRAAGAKMIVMEDGRLVGSVGGGLLEGQTLDAAREVWTTRRARLLNFDLMGEGAESAGMICGGVVDVYLEYLDPARRDLLEFHRALADAGAVGPAACALEIVQAGAHGRRFILDGRGHASFPPGPAPVELEALERILAEGKWLRAGVYGGLFAEPVAAAPTVFIFGGGHVSAQIAPLAALVDFRVVVVDDRPEFADPRRFPTAHAVLLQEFEGVMDRLAAEYGLGPTAYLVIVTRGHRHDGVVLAQALATRAAYVGMIGSRRKREAIFQAMREKGFAPDDLARVHSPIGLAIGAETPEEIAVSIIAELIAARAGAAR